MTKTEFEKRVRALVGSERGYQIAAAERLGVSVRALREALKTGKVGPKIERALVAAELGAREVKSDGWGPLTATAGAWAFGVPETKSRDPRVVGELLLTHLATPFFVVHVVMRDTGLGDIYRDMLRDIDAAREMQDLSVHFEKNVRWFEEPSSPERRARLLEMAFEKAEARLRQDIVDAKESAARDAMLARVKEHGALDEGDARGESMAALATAVRTGSDRELRLETATLERESAELLSEHTALLQGVQRDGAATAGDVRRAFDLGERRGRVKAMLGWCFQASMHLDGDIGRLIVARVINGRKLAHKTTARGAH